MFSCKECSFQSSSAVAYMKHCRIHSNSSAITCGVPGCGYQCRKISTFYKHVSHRHELVRDRNKRQFLQNIGIKAKCQVQTCQKVVSLHEMVKHLKSHLDTGIKIQCPVALCGRIMNKKSTFAAHMLYKHRSLTLSNASQDIVCRTEQCSSANTESIVLVNAHEDEYRAHESDCDDENTVINDDALLKNIALFLLKLQCNLNVPASTVDFIASEANNLHSLGFEKSLHLLKTNLSRQQVTADKVDSIVSVVKRQDVFHVAFNSDSGILRSHYKRLKYYKKNFRYCEPVEISLGKNKYNKDCVLHYIPLHETLKNLLTDESVCKSLLCLTDAPHGVFCDVHHGEVFRNILSTCKDPSCLGIILYQDAFEIVNPLGSAKKVHKIVGVYFALANLPCHIRGSIDSIQLVLLCRENDLNSFGLGKVFSNVMNDLVELEANGLHVNSKDYAVRLICVLGDNLGSHLFGGFTTNFSTNRFICRYCLIEKKSEDHCYLARTDELRTPENYQLALSSITDADPQPVQGIIKESVLHKLRFYHVCMPGLPPCLGHDLFEGIIQYDVALMLKSLSLKQKSGNLMSIAHLNQALKVFKFSEMDGRDKPAVVSDGRTIGGHAAQNWCLVRFLPILLFDVIDFDDRAWELFILLREIVELVCAPKISEMQIFYLNRLVNLYIEERLNLYPHVPLRPKHHYLLHYPHLITMFGPLIRVWTMRMESKHSFFKQCARSSKNFVNVTKTLSQTHQLNQAFLSSGSFVCDNIDLGNDCTAFDKELFASSIVSAVSLKGLSSPVHCSTSVTVKGTKYSKDLYVVLGRIDSDLVFGKLMLCLLDGDSAVSFVVSSWNSVKINHLGLYRILPEDDEDIIRCVLLTELCDYCPISGYVIGDVTYIPLKHAVCDIYYD